VTLLHVITAIIQLGGGISLAVGIQPRLSALALGLLLVPITLLYHPFWLRTGSSFVEELNHFLSNLGLIGGMLVIVVRGAANAFDTKYADLAQSGPYSILTRRNIEQRQEILACPINHLCANAMRPMNQGVGSSNLSGRANKLF
jgi:SURF4 family